MSDVKDILEWDIDGSNKAPPKEQETIVVPSKEEIIAGNDKKSKPKKNNEPLFKRPEGMHREVYALLYSDKNLCERQKSLRPPPLIPTDTQQGYKNESKAWTVLCTTWKWMPFTNPARKTICMLLLSQFQAQLYKQYEREEFDFSRMNCKGVSKKEKRSVEDIKDRYYNIVNKLSKVRSDPNLSSRAQQSYDAEHERKRKEQLNRLFDRTTEQVEEEEMLIQELRGLNSGEEEREKKAQDLQKLITAADNSSDLRRTERKIIKKKLPITLSSRKKDPEGCMKGSWVVFATGSREDRYEHLANPETGGIKFPDIKQSGVYLRSQKMKLPSSVGQKKTKAIEHLLDELGIPIQPMPTDEICQLYNDLRSDMVLLYELKLAHANCEFEMQTLRHRYEALAPGKLPSTSILTPASLSTLTKQRRRSRRKQRATPLQSFQALHLRSKR
ncbi:putative DNA methyltransferase 1-associated protein 1 [Apostichopus japonicus]|uniref:Putative DNA methyltransferase 1-associated protein 1 n=1 Tax=Stichopus japonicus TaxID=307972 RepID=A0A2G8LBL8_STIJA|nr:putative DNA methyltransferase 1-associated protein 1 [Apostichopus japonicus]